MTLIAFIAIGALVGACVGAGYYALLRTSKTHIAALLSNNNAAAREHPAAALPAAPQPLGDITWDFDHVLGMTGGGGQDVYVVTLQLAGKNNLDSPILHMNGVWRSDVTNATLPVRFVVNGQLVPPEATNGIPRKSSFVVASTQLPQSDPPREGMAATKFLVDFATFTLELDYDGTHFVHHFSNDGIWREVETFRRISLGPTQPPGVTLKKPK